MTGKRASGAFFWLWLLLSLLAVVGASEIGAQDNDSAESISERLQILKAKSLKLEQLWREQKIALETAVVLSQRLEQELSAALEQLENSEASLATSQQELTRLTGLLEASQTTLSGLRSSFLSYQQATEQTIRNRTIGMIAGWVTAVLAVLFAAFNM